MTPLQYTTTVARRRRWFTWPLRVIVGLALLLAVGMLVLMLRDGHGTDEFSLSVRRLKIRFMSNRGQLAFSLEDQYQPLSLMSLCGAVPPGTPPIVPPMPVWSHDFLDDTGWPQYDDKSSYMIASEYHPYIEWRRGGYNRGHFKTFAIDRPLLTGPNPPYVLFGCGMVLPTLWIVGLLVTPFAAWTTGAMLSRRRRRHSSRWSIEAA